MTTTETSNPIIEDELAKLLIKSFNSQAEMPVHMLFNYWWSHASPQVTSAYVEAFLSDAGERVTSPGAKISEPLDLDLAGEMAKGTLGRAYYDWIVENGLQASIATDYRALHEALAGAGLLDGMPDVMQSAVLRGFQVHDFQHVLTGYDPSGRGEISLQAF